MSMQSRGRFFIILGVVLLALAIVGGLLIVALQLRGRGIPGIPSARPTEEGATEVAPETKDVVVALQNIGEGEKIRPDAVGVRPVEVEKLPEDPILDSGEVVGKLARRDIYQAEVLVDDMVIAVEDVQRLGGRAASLIPTGRVAYAIPVTQLAAVNYAIQAGDRVDVLISGSFIDVDPDSQIEMPLTLVGEEDCQPGCQVVGDQLERTFTQLTIDDAEVLGLGVWGAPPSEEEAAPAEGEGEAAEAVGVPSSAFDSIILIVTPQDSAVLKYALENRFLVDLVLRSREDRDPHKTEQVTLEYIMARFGIATPAKLPYALKNETEVIGIPTPEAPPE
jgi:Flp pilus assembly protein CpaB